MEDNNSIFLDQKDNEYDLKWRKKLDNAKEYQEEHDHPVWKKYIKEGVRGRTRWYGLACITSFFDSVRNNKLAPIDIYDTAAWMSITCLSEQSIAMDRMSVAIPDFTNGMWMHRMPWKP